MLLPLSEEHGVTALLAESVRHFDVNEVPEDVRRKLRERHRAQLVFTLSMTAELFRLLKHFAVAGVETLVVKGPVLSVRAYGDPGVRQYADLDLLVRHRDIVGATELLIREGFEPDVPLKAIAAGKIPGEYLFTRPNTNLLVELHTEHTFRYFPRPLPLEDFFQRQVRVTVDACSVPALAVEDELVLICIHGAKHFWERLMWIADVAAIVSRQTTVDWEAVQHTARQVGGARMLHAGLRLAANQLKMLIPDAMDARIQSDSDSQRLSAQIAGWLPTAGYAPPPLLKRAIFRIRMRGSLISGLAYLCRLSLSPTEEDWVEGAEEKRWWLWDAIRRPFRLISKYWQG